MAQLISVKLSRFDGSPWGFRLQGGKDFGTPLIVQKVNNGSPAEAAGLRAGDAVIKVNNTEMFNLRHKDAQDVIVRSGNNFEVTVQRGGSTWRPSVSPVTPSIPSPQPHLSSNSISPVTKTSLAAKKQEGSLIGSGHNFSPKPFLNGTSDSGPIKSIVNKQYNSPVGIYSEQTIAETLSAQAEVLAGGVLGVNFKKNEKNYDAGNSEVFKMVQEADKEPKTPEPAEPVHSSGVVTPSSPALAGLRSVAAPETKVPQPTTPQSNLPPGQNICAECERLIVGVFVRIKEKNLHVECFKCSTCGTSLKNVGYYNINNKLYCDIHAKLVARQQAPAGYVPITVPPGAKAPAGTISAALGNLPTSTPKPAPVNGTSASPHFSTIHQRPNSDLGRPARGYSRLSEVSPTNGHRNDPDKDMLDEKTYTSTITIRTGSEVGSEDCLDNNQNETNKKYVVTSHLRPSLRIEDDKSPGLIINEQIEKAVVGTCAIPRYPITNQRTRSPAFTSHPAQNNHKFKENGVNNLINRDKTDYSKTDDFQNYDLHLNNHRLKFGEVISALTNAGQDSKVNGSSPKYINGTSGINNKILSKDNNRLQSKNEINHAMPSNFCTSSSSLASFLLAHRTTHPETLPASPTTTPDSSSSSISSSPTPPIIMRNNQFGIQPNDTPSLGPVQAPSSNLGGPKPFGTSSVAPPSFSTPSAPTSAVNSSSRPQNQTITESYHAECNYYKEVIETLTPAEEIPRPPSSVKSKSLQWPPIKSIEDHTFPTASPVWIDPNPVLHRSSRQNVREKRCHLQEAALHSQNISTTEDYEPEHICWGESAMDNTKPNCNQPFYRKTESCMETRREYRSESSESSRRSLTPTRIQQPTPKPWVGTVSSGAYSHVQAPHPPEPPVARKVCTCRIVCEKTCGPSGPEHEQEHHYHEVICELCNPPPQPQAEPQPVCLYEQQAEKQVDEIVQETDSETIDLSKVVPDDIAVCPKGVESQHNMYTETMEKDEGNLHIKKTTVYEKTVEVLSPNRPASPVSDSETGRQSATSMDKEVEEFSGRREYVEAASVISSAIETNRQVEELKKQEEERRRQYEEECRREQERIRHEEEEFQRREENRLRIIREEKAAKERRIEESRRQTEICCRQEEEERSGKHVSFQSQPRGTYQEEKQYLREEERSHGEQRSQECYRLMKKEVEIQENYNQLQEDQRHNLREQVEVHKSLRQQQGPERQMSLQERRIAKRFRPQTSEEVQEAMCQRKHVQFVTDSESGIRALPQTSVKNAIPKEYKSPMCDALTTAPARPFSPLHPGVSKIEETQRTYSTEVRYQEISHQPPPPQPPFEPQHYGGPYERPASPFVDALEIAPDRPYTPLGNESTELITIPVDRADTPINKEEQGYCHPAEILYTDVTTRQSRCRERTLRKIEGPRPLPTPPPDYRFRDSSASSARSLSRPCTPREPTKISTATLKKPDTIPFYQKNLIAVEQGPVEGTSYVPSRSPTPHRTKSPAAGPPEPPACYTRAHAPRIREESQQVCQRTSQQSQSDLAQSSTGPEQCEKLSYHMEEDTPQGHKSQDYTGSRSAYYGQSQEKSQQRQIHSQQQQLQSYITQYQKVEEQRIEERRSCGEESADESDTCSISKVARTQPSLPCPISHSAITDRIQRTGVRVLPPCPLSTSSSQVSETRRVYQQEQQSASNSYSSSQREESTCANTGVTVLPCRATTESGASKAGIVIIPCEGAESSETCPRAGICVTPTPDRHGLCVSPVNHGKSAAKCVGDKGIRSGGCEIDVGNCPASGVRVGTCTDGSVCIGPCKVPGVKSVACPKPIIKPKCPLSKPIPYPHIPLPNELNIEPCDVCPLKSQQQSVQSQQKQQPKTTLSQQLTCMSVKRNKQMIQLFKTPSEQCDDGQHCRPSEGSCSDGLHCEPKNICSDGLHCGPEDTQNTRSRVPYAPQPSSKTQNSVAPPNLSCQPDLGSGIGGGKSGKFAGSTAPKRGKGILNQGANGDLTNSITNGQSLRPICCCCDTEITRGPFITALGQIWCPDHFVCVNPQCRRHLQDIGFVEEKGQLYCEYCFERFIAPSCNKCSQKIKGDCLNAIGKHYHPECFNCAYCGKLFGNSPFFLEEGLPYCEADWNELFTTKCFACGFPVEAGDRWVEALNNNYHSQCFNCTMCKKNLEGQSFYAKGGRPFCKNHAR